MILIRKAVITDAKAVNNLDKEWEKEGSSWTFYMAPNAEKGIKKEIKNDLFYVAEEEGSIFGYIHGSIKRAKEEIQEYAIKEGEKYGEIESLYVIKRFRKKHTGGVLVRKILHDFREKGIKKVVLWSANKDFDITLEFYKKFGFEPRDIYMVLDLK